MVMKLYVGNLPHSYSEAELTTLFATFGTVVSAKIIVDRVTGRSKGYGFVEMSSTEEGQAAINGLNGKEVGGRPLTVNEARPQTERRGPSGNRAGGNRRY